MSVAYQSDLPDEFKGAENKYPPAFMRLLYNRGLKSAEQIDSYLNPTYGSIVDPFRFRDMTRACERIEHALRGSEGIAIHGDYDADGISACAILSTVLELLGQKPTVFLPHREVDGYGLNSGAIETFARQGVSLMITCDCGIAHATEVNHARRLGIDTIVTDHHQPGDALPDAYAIIHPSLPGETYPSKNLTGGGVAFKLAQALVSRSSRLLGRDREIKEKWLLDLVAVATIADMGELLGENRTLVKYGLVVLSKTRRAGLKKLMLNAGLDTNRLTSESVSFYIAPRLNAAGRVGHPNTALRLLLTEDEHEATSLAGTIEQQNRERRTLTTRLYGKIIQSIERDGAVGPIVIFDAECPVGILGLLAGKVSRTADRPAFIITEHAGQCIGSGRSGPGGDVLGSVSAVRELLTAYGGHREACGFRLSKDRLSELLLKLREQTFSESETKNAAIGTRLHFSEITDEMTRLIELCEPFGHGNTEPSFISEGVEVVSLRRVGKSHNHLKLILRQDALCSNAVMFNSSSRDIYVGDYANFVYTIRRNIWHGHITTELHVSSFYVIK